LAFIGVKMILHALHENGVDVPDISLEVSLTVIVSALTITALTSLYATRDKTAKEKEVS
jgi:tellurite resistance protein TerC